MYCINDFGKIWVLGFIRPEPSVRVDDIYFVVGEGDLQNINYSLYKKYLFVVVHLPEKKTRVFRRFSLGLVPRTQGTLFNGFTKTKHADIKAITYRDAECSKKHCI